MSIAGAWHNELGSKMLLTPDGSSLRGIYETEVGDAKGIYNLLGGIFSSDTQDPKVQAVGFVVAWVNEHKTSNSVTSWSGQYHVDEDKIFTQWLLTMGTSSGNEWESTLIYHDVFTRIPPTAEQSALRLKRGPRPHP